MDSIYIIGNALFFTIGVGVGVTIFYVFELIMDWKEDREKWMKESRK